MKTLCLVATSLSVALLTVSSGVAGEGERDRPDRSEMREKMIERFDADGDGELSKEERAKARSEGRGRRGGKGGPKGEGRMDPGAMFDRFDADGDGQLSREEFMQLADVMRRMRERMGPPPRDGGPREARRPRGERPGPKDSPKGPRGRRGGEFDGDRFGPLQNPGPDAPRDELRPRGPRGERGSRGKPGPEGRPAGPPSPEAIFDHFDADGDEQLSRDEFMELAERMRAMRDRFGRRGEGPPGPADGEFQRRPPRKERRGPRPDFGSFEDQGSPGVATENETA